MRIVNTKFEMIEQTFYDILHLFYYTLLNRRNRIYKLQSIEILN